MFAAGNKRERRSRQATTFKATYSGIHVSLDARSVSTGPTFDCFGRIRKNRSAFLKLDYARGSRKLFL